MDIAVILAAGMGSRMKSKLIKVLHPILGKPMVQWSIDSATQAGFKSLVVVGNQEDAVREALKNSGVSFARQSTPKGTGHAVQCAMDELRSLNAERVLVFFGDTPLFRPATLSALKEFHVSNGFDVSFVTATLDNAGSYGRLIRNDAGEAQKIVEAANATPEELSVCEINTGAAMFEMSWLEEHLMTFEEHPPKGEIYLTDALEIAARSRKAGAMILRDAQEADGVNTRVDLAKATCVLQERIVEQQLLKGVTIVDPKNITIEPDVEIGMDVHLDRGVVLRGTTRIENGAVIDAHSLLEDTVVGMNTTIHAHSHCVGATLGNNVQIGPFARLREGSIVKDRAKVGNFVEMKKSVLGQGAKASHLTYLGDANIGAKANIGAGTITCNYDGFNKHKTEIGEGAFIGSNTSLVAPVRVGEGAIVGAGTVLTQSVSNDALAVARPEQKNIEGAAKRFRTRMSPK